MSSLADKAILSGADNRHPMLEKDMYDSWRSRMELYMLNRQHGRMILESVEHGPLLWPTLEEDGVTRLKKYSELFAAKAIQADCDVKATNIILQALPPEIYALERECKLYDAFDKFAYQKGEILRDFYLRFSLLLDDMNMYIIKLEQFQVNIKFLNTLPLEWSKFVTDVKLVRDLHTTNVDQLHAYLGQHEYHANEVRLMHERTSDSLALVSQHQLHMSTYQHHQQSYHQPQFQQQASTYQASPYASSYHTPQNKMEHVLQENDRLLTQALSVEIVNVVVHDNVMFDCLNVDVCAHCVTIESELKKDFIKKESYETLLQQYHTLEKHCISLEVNNQLKREIFQKNTLSSSESAPTFAEFFEINELKAQAQGKGHSDFAIKRETPFSQRHTLDEAATLREIVKSERLLSPLNISLDYALVVTPKNKTKQIRRTEQLTNSGKTTVTTPPSANLDSNTPVLSSTGVILVSSASGSMSQDNTKKNRIQRTQRKAKKNKVKDHLRNVKSSLNKKSVVDSKATSSVLNFVSYVNSDLKCASCNGCLFSDNHDACVVD
nr:hypothetical protein [Tanacetum cinerariifolium]